MTIISASGRALGLGAVAVLVGLLQPPDAAAQQGEEVAEGARLYGQTCARCHNPRPSTERSDRDWTTIMGHMRTRANLSKSDTRAILAFLQATNGSPGEASAGASSVEDENQAGDEVTSVPSLVLVLSDTESNGFPLLRAITPSVWTDGLVPATPCLSDSGASREP